MDLKHPQICEYGFAILRTGTPKKFADLHLRNAGMCRMQEFADLLFADLKKFACPPDVSEMLECGCNVHTV